MATRTRRIGLWMIGAAGNVATTVVVGLAALRRGLIEPTGLTTCTPRVRGLDLAPLDAIVVGGHEISRRTVLQTAAELQKRSRIFGEDLLETVRPDLRRYHGAIRPGTTFGCGRAITRLAARPTPVRETAAAVVARLRRDLRAFRRRHRLDRVVAVNLASTEPPFRLGPVHREWRRLEAALSRRENAILPASSLYAIAAILEGTPYVNFTPSLGADVPAIIELAVARRVPIMGADGKTGETLLKSVLAPMFRERNLEILSWVGHNILGNRDGMVLQEPPNKVAKVSTKDRVVARLLGYQPQTITEIDFVESLHDWKTAWDHIHFRGFLGVKMTLQFVWQGCDSILAAPLVIDLVRLVDHYAARGGAGVMTHLAPFFKAPMQASDHDFFHQVELLHRQLHGDGTPRSRV